MFTVSVQHDTTRGLEYVTGLTMETESAIEFQMYWKGVCLIQDFYSASKKVTSNTGLTVYRVS